MPPRTLQKLVNVPRGKEREVLLPVVGPECWQRIADQRSEAEESDPATFSVAAGRVYSRTVLASAGQRVSWTFGLEGRDIDFGVKLYGQTSRGETQARNDIVTVA